MSETTWTITVVVGFLILAALLVSLPSSADRGDNFQRELACLEGGHLWIAGKCE